MRSDSADTPCFAELVEPVVVKSQGVTCTTGFRCVFGASNEIVRVHLRARCAVRIVRCGARGARGARVSCVHTAMHVITAELHVSARARCQCASTHALCTLRTAHCVLTNVRYVRPHVRN